MAASPAHRRDRRRFLALSAVTVLTAALALPALAAGPAVPTAKKTTKKVVTPKLGASCSKSQLNARYGTLACKKSGSSYKWVRASTSSTSSGSSAAVATPATSEAVNPSQIDVIALVNGSAPAAYGIKVDVKCNGLAQNPKDGTASVSFGAQGGTNQVTFKLSPPNVDNPTGSTCAVTSTSTGATPSVRLLINGRPATNATATASVTTPDFTAEGPYTVTALVDFGGAAPASAPAATTTTAPAAGGTTTIPAPASGRPEVGVRWLGTIPAAVTGIDILTTCTSATPGGAFQTQLQRLGRADGSTPLALTLAAPSGTFAGTSCQITGTLLGGDATSAALRIYLRGNVVAGPNSGSLINSPAFAAPSAWQATIEVAYGGATASTTTIASSTTIGATTTTLAPRATIALARTGTAPIAVTGYVVDVACNNITKDGVALVFANWNATYPATGATAELPFTFGPSSSCSVKVATTGSTAGVVSVAINGSPVGAGAGGTVQTPTVSTPTAFATTITIAY